MEKALRHELNKHILEIENRIYPTNAPEGVVGSYLVYARISTKNLKTFNGIENEGSMSFMFSVISKRYGDMKNIVKKIEELLKSMPLTEIGKDEKIYIEDITINNVTDVYEDGLKAERGIIDFTIYY